MKITVADKVCVAGLMMTKDTLREYLPNLTGKSWGGDRQALDASCARRSAGLNLLHTNFIHENMIVTTPAKWFHDMTKESIDNIMGDGTYNENGIFDPNNPARINLPWTLEV